jgi:uncharacterized membrane protein
MAPAAPDALADLDVLDAAVGPMEAVADRLLADPTVDAALRGEWLGHPLHPMLTDLPIGFWTSAFVLDFGGKRLRLASDLMVAAGLLCVPPTAAAGLADWRQRDQGDRRVGVVHAAANTTATVLYLCSLVQRVRGRRLKGVLLSWAGATAATAGGYLGGRLAFAPSDPEPVVEPVWSGRASIP